MDAVIEDGGVIGCSAPVEVRAGAAVFDSAAACIIIAGANESAIAPNTREDCVAES